MNATLSAKLILVAAFLLGCQDIRDARSGSGSAAKKAPDRGAPFDDSADSATLADLFRDDVAFTIPELTGGRTNCEDVTRRGGIEDEIVPWPKELKNFLVGQLKDLPIRQQILDSVFAIYLVEDLVLQGSIGGTGAAGLACDRGTDYKGVIFLNADTFVESRRAKGLGTWQDLASVQDRYILLESGDNAAMTLVHEVMHAIDNKLFVNGPDAEDNARRRAIYDLSWVDHDEPKFDRISIMALTEPEPRLYPGCRTRPRGEEVPPDSIALTAGGTASTLAAELRYLAEKTNFLVPYATVTAAEDFAESLTIYYFGAYKDSWQTRTVYREDLGGKGVQDNTPLYVHKTKDILRRKGPQREKVCQLAELVFASCKL